MLGHLGVNVPELPAARAYYGTLMPLLDFELFADTADQVAYMPAAGKRGTFLFFYRASEAAPYSGMGVGLQHLAFMVRRVREVHANALTLGSSEVHPPQHWPPYPQPYYAAFWLDPFGLMLEAVCHHDREN